MSGPDADHSRCHQWAADAYDHGYADGQAARSCAGTQNDSNPGPEPARTTPDLRADAEPPPPT